MHESAVARDKVMCYIARSFAVLVGAPAPEEVRMSSYDKFVLLRRGLWGLLLISSMLASYAAASFWQHRRRLPTSAIVSETRSSSSPTTPENPFAADNGRHLIAYVITASDCGWSKQPAMMETIRTLRTRLQSRYQSTYARVSVVGVAFDKDLEAGLRFLSDISKDRRAESFDQVIAGGSWLNEQIVRLVWRERVATAISPQVLVVERPVDTESYLSSSVIAVADDVVVANPAGNNQILRWIRQEMPLRNIGAPVPSAHRGR